jgi:hypothetical protein
MKQFYWRLYSMINNKKYVFLALVVLIVTAIGAQAVVLNMIPQ